MSEPPDLLLPGERLLLYRHPHLLILLAPLLLLTLGFAAFLLLFCPVAHQQAIDGRCPFLTGAVVGTIAVIVTLDYLATCYLLTTQRLIVERGIVGREVQEVPLRKVQDIALKQDFWGRLFDYGDLVIESAGTEGVVRWLGVAAPLYVQQQVQRAIEQQRRLKQKRVWLPYAN